MAVPHGSVAVLGSAMGMWQLSLEFHGSVAMWECHGSMAVPWKYGTVFFPLTITVSEISVNGNTYKNGNAIETEIN